MDIDFPVSDLSRNIVIYVYVYVCGGTAKNIHCLIYCFEFLCTPEQIIESFLDRFCYCFTGLSLVERSADLNGSPFVCGLAESCSLHTQGNIVDTDTGACSLTIR